MKTDEIRKKGDRLFAKAVNARDLGDYKQARRLVDLTRLYAKSPGILQGDSTLRVE